ncbi:hypothetical protein EVG20_g5721 [Dentipellis fragilis]|uniref:F-box domain-containing protein n=1 Tax=Dentipellis fragilis TaxID=205917 RepID=A0A4Y9YRL9_9AGAM|nr:hypothetical protein EVG20_g5721 [Dentipellis fragilis]
MVDGNLTVPSIPTFYWVYTHNIRTRSANIRLHAVTNISSLLSPIMDAQNAGHPSHFHEQEDGIQVTPESIAGTSVVLESYVREKLLSSANVTTFSSIAAIEKAQAYLDAEMDVLKRALRSFCVRRNAISIISRLPADVLLHIFTILVEVDPPTMTRAGRERQQCLGWIQVTHVCHFWREISLSDSGLWSRIGRGLSKQWIMAMLSRSKSRPLKVDLVSQMTASEDTLSEILSPDYLARVSELGLEDSTGDHLWAQKLQAPAPFLSFLRLHFIEPQNQTSWPLPEVISAASYPSLRHLIIYNHSQPPCDAHALENLAHLEISGKWHYYDQPTAEHFIPIIQQLSRLQTLILKRCRPYGHPASFDEYLNRRRHSLPHLKKLSLQGFGYAIPLLLSWMDIPASARVSLHLENYHWRSESSSWLLIPQLLPWAATPVIDGESHFKRLTFDMRWGISFCTSAKSDGSYPTISSNVESFHYPDGLHLFLREFYVLRYFRPISRLILSAPFDGFVNSHGVEGLLINPSMMEVTELRLVMPISTLPCLLRNLALPAENGHGCRMLPALKLVTLEGPGSLPSDGSAQIPYDLPQSLQEDLLYFLQARCSLGKPVTCTLLPSITDAEEFRGRTQHSVVAHPGITRTSDAHSSEPE